MVTIIVETNWPAESSKKLAEIWIAMSDVPEQMTMHYVGTRGEADCSRALVKVHPP